MKRFLRWLLPLYAVYGHVGEGRWNAFNGTSLAYLGRAYPREMPLLWLRCPDGTVVMRRAAAVRVRDAAVKYDFYMRRPDAGYIVRMYEHDGGLRVLLGVPGVARGVDGG